MVNTNGILVLFLLLLLLLLIHDSLHAPPPLGEDNKTMDIQSISINQQSNRVSQCQRLFTYKEILEILAHSPCASSMKDINESVPLRRKRATGGDDETVASTNNIYALQSTINDHRTMIDDHRKIIHYLMNNTVNVTQLNQYYTDQHAYTTPIWKSWRDLSLLLLIFICFGVIVCLLIKRLPLLNFLTTILIRRQHQQQQLQGKSIRKKNRTQIPASIVEPMSISNITRDYIRHERDSNSSI